MRQKLTEAQLDTKLKGNLLYEGLNESQREFVKLYIINNGDLTNTSFTSHKEYRYRRNARIIALLRVFGFTELQETAVQSKELLRLTSYRLRLPETTNEEFIKLATLAQGLQEKTERKRPKKAPATIDAAVLAAERKQ
jgi:hypothetical protein